MAGLLITLYHRAQSKASQQMEELNSQLQNDCQKLKVRETELKEAIRDLERFNTVSVGRENRIIELKNEVNALLEEMNRTQRYNTVHIE
jgi:septal ring factor EnvC (AmiA/AmiB activator)